MTLHAGDWSVELILPSRLGSGEPFMRELLGRLKDLDWPDAEVFGIHLAVEEAVVNAIRHGNKFDESKVVRIACHLTHDLLRIQITDQGRGFDPNAVPDCTAEERLEVPSGRGVMLMKCFMNQVAYNSTGNRVIMEKHRGVAIEQPDDCADGDD